MCGLTNGRRAGIRHALGSALITGVGGPLCLMAFGGFQGTISAAEGVALAAFLVVVVLVFATFGDRRGFVLIWILFVGVWLFSIVTEGAEPLPERFIVWSSIALPLGLSTEIFLCAAHSRRLSRGFVLVGSVWIVVVLGSVYLARYAPDVGMTPRQHPIIRLLIPLLLLPTPPILSLWMIQRSAKTGRRSS